MVTIRVEPLNDPPVAHPGSSVVQHNQDMSIVLNLESTDHDNAGQQAFARIARWPQVGVVYQVDAAGERLGEIPRSSGEAYQLTQWASKVLRFSSQESNCGGECTSFLNNDCVQCGDTSRNAVNILGTNEVYPASGLQDLVWQIFKPSSGFLEFIELEFPSPV